MRIVTFRALMPGCFSDVLLQIWLIEIIHNLLFFVSVYRNCIDTIHSIITLIISKLASDVLYRSDTLTS